MFAKLKTLIAFTIKQLSDKFILKYFKGPAIIFGGGGKKFI